MSKIIAILGATGNQGGSVVHTFQSDKIQPWQIRAITRNTNSPKAQALQALDGVEVISADLNDPASLQAAFKGVHAIFAVTNFEWATVFDPATKDRCKPGQTTHEVAYEDELQQGKNVIDAAAKVETLERLVYSSLPDATKWSNGKFDKIYHFTAKAHAVDYLKGSFPRLWEKTSVYQPGWFLSNWLYFPTMKPQKQKDGSFNFPLALPPTKKFPFIAAESDTGPFVHTLISSSTSGQQIQNLLAYRCQASIQEIADTFAKLHNVNVQCVQIDLSDDAIEGDIFMQGFKENMAYFDQIGYFGFQISEAGTVDEVLTSDDLPNKPDLGTLEDWMKLQDWSGILDGR